MENASDVHVITAVMVQHDAHPQYVLPLVTAGETSTEPPSTERL